MHQTVTTSPWPNQQFIAPAVLNLDSKVGSEAMAVPLMEARPSEIRVWAQVASQSSAVTFCVALSSPFPTRVTISRSDFGTVRW
jgi:hypothetical protein